MYHPLFLPIICAGRVGLPYDLPSQNCSIYVKICRLSPRRKGNNMKCAINRICLISCLVVFGLIFSIHVASADDVVLKDGRRFEGKVLENTSSQVIIDAIIAGIRQKLVFVASEVDGVYLTDGGYEFPEINKSRETEEPPAPKLLVLPMHGEVGTQITAEYLQKMLEFALSRHVSGVILDIDSPGGYVAEVHLILDVISNYRGKLRLVAFIHNKALSAAAMIAMSCPEIIVTPEAQLGSAVIINGLTDASVAAKYVSNDWSRISAATEAAGHSGAAMMAMMQMEAKLYAVEKDGKWTLVSQAPEDDKSAIELDGPDTILNLRTSQAVKYGIALGSCDQISDMARVLGCTDCEVDVETGVKSLKHYLTQQARDQRRQDALQRRIENEAIQKSEAKKQRFEKLLNDLEFTISKMGSEKTEALLSDPNNFTYYVYSLTGLLTPDSMRRWKTNTDLAISRWQNISTLARRAAKIIKELERDYETDLSNSQILIDKYNTDAQSALSTLRDRRNLGP